jgi:hypothetical protein
MKVVYRLLVLVMVVLLVLPLVPAQAQDEPDLSESFITSGGLSVRDPEDFEVTEGGSQEITLGKRM